MSRTVAADQFEGSGGGAAGPVPQRGQLVGGATTNTGWGLKFFQ